MSVRKATLLFTFLILMSPLVSAGPIFLSGDDSEDHFPPPFSPCSSLAILPVFQNILDNVANSGSDILALGISSSTSSAGKFVTAVADCLSPAQSVTLVTGTNINTVDFTGYAIIWVPSNSNDTGGGISQVNNTRVVNRKSDIQTFVNGGGGLIILTQGILTDAWDMVVGDCGAAGDITDLAVTATGNYPNCVTELCFAGTEVCCYNDVSATATGIDFGLSDTNYDHCCFHTVFTAYPSFYSSLTLANVDPTANGDAQDYHNQAEAIGGVTSICGSDDWGWTYRL